MTPKVKYKKNVQETTKQLFLLKERGEQMNKKPRCTHEWCCRHIFSNVCNAAAEKLNGENEKKHKERKTR